MTDPLPPHEALAVAAEEMPHHANGQHWMVAWHPTREPPAGRPHGATAVCVDADGMVVLISPDGSRWGLPGGRPEGNESWEATMRREMWEEACATVTRASLLGFSRGRCVRGHEAGLVLVRSLWRAEVDLAPWEPRFEIPHRRSVPPASAAAEMSLSADRDGEDRILLRLLAEAGLPVEQHRSEGSAP